MDTWATSSLTPEIAAGWEDDPDLFARVFPMDLRPQAFEIIRTWLFSTIVRAHFEFDSLPWTDAAISGWVLDPDRKKMSKSKGNVVTPMEPIRQFGADAMRYWAASGRPGVDTAVDEGQMKVGRRLAIKILNASKFALGVMGDDVLTARRPTRSPSRSTARCWRALAALVTNATTSFDGYDYARALDATERFFWGFCDDYLELVKGRAVRGFRLGARRARGRARHAAAIVRAAHAVRDRRGVVVVARRLDPPRVVADGRRARRRSRTTTSRSTPRPPRCSARSARRRARPSARCAPTSPHAVVRAPAELLRALEPALDDVRDAGRVVGELELVEADELSVDVTLVDPE